MYFNSPSALTIVPLTETPTHSRQNQQTHTHTHTHTHTYIKLLSLSVSPSLSLAPPFLSHIFLELWVFFLLMKTQTVVTETDMRADKDKL